jgi:hypothetical protein
MVMSPPTTILTLPCPEIETVKVGGVGVGVGVTVGVTVAVGVGVTVGIGVGVGVGLEIQPWAVNGEAMLQFVPPESEHGIAA